MTDRELMQQALEALELYQSKMSVQMFDDTAKALRERLAAPPTQPEQRPVAVWELEEDGWNTIADPDWMETLPVGTRLYTAPPKRECCQSIIDVLKRTREAISAIRTDAGHPVKGTILMADTNESLLDVLNRAIQARR